MGKEKSKTELAYQILLDEILEGRLYPGQRLIERELVTQLGMSKTPVREALLRLKEEGLLQGVLNQSVSVARITFKDAVEIYDMREVLEGLAAKTAAAKITPQSEKKLLALIELSEKYCKENKMKEYAEADLELHHLIGLISDNQRLCEALSRFRNQSRILIRNVTKLLGRGGKVSLMEHKEIVQAIVNKDPELAEIKAKEHIRKARQSVFELLDALGLK